MMRQIWWKIITFLILLYVGTMGFLVAVPNLDGRLQQSVRNLFFHVPMWVCMMVLFTFSVVNAVKYLKDGRSDSDVYSLEFARTGCVFSLLGLGTGMIWAKYQWGAAWSSDPKQNGATIAILIYFAYFVLRGAITDDEKKAKIGAVYNIFAYCILFPTLYILPRMTESLHPGGQGSEGNPGLNPDDTTTAMKTVMIPAFIGWSLVGIWIATLRVRYKLLLNKVEDRTLENQ